MEIVMIEMGRNLLLFSHCHVRLCNPTDCSTQVPVPSLSFTVSQILLKLMSIESVMPSNCCILCCPLLFMPSIFPSIRVFSNEMALCIRWPKYWASASASVLPKNIQSLFPLGLTGLISLLSKELSRIFSNTDSLKASILQCSAFFMIQLSHLHDYWKNHSFDYSDLCRQSNVSAF